MEIIELFENLETDRLLLRQIVDSDAETLYENLYRNFDHYKFYYQFPYKNLEDFRQKYKYGSFFKWVIVLKENNEPIGIVELHTYDSLNNNCRIGYIVGDKYRKKGYAYEAVKKIIEFGFNHLYIHKIEAHIVADNTASIKLAESVGMTLESIRKDSYKIGDNYYNQKVYTIINNNK